MNKEIQEEKFYTLSEVISLGIDGLMDYGKLYYYATALSKPNSSNHQLIKKKLKGINITTRTIPWNKKTEFLIQGSEILKFLR